MVFVVCCYSACGAAFLGLLIDVSARTIMHTSYYLSCMFDHEVGCRHDTAAQAAIMTAKSD